MVPLFANSLHNFFLFLWTVFLLLTVDIMCVSGMLWMAYSKDQFSLVQLLSCVQLFAASMDCSTQGFPVPHQLTEPTQTYVHWFGDAIQPSHPRLSPSPPTFNLSQHQGFSK